MPISLNPWTRRDGLQGGLQHGKGLGPGDPMAAPDKAFRGLAQGSLILPADLIALYRMYQDNDLDLLHLQTQFISIRVLC